MPSAKEWAVITPTMSSAFLASAPFNSLTSGAPWFYPSVGQVDQHQAGNHTRQCEPFLFCQTFLNETVTCREHQAGRDCSTNTEPFLIDVFADSQRQRT